MAAPRLPVFGRPSGFESTSPASEVQRETTTPGALTKALPAVDLPSSAGPAMNLASSSPLRVSQQTFETTVPAASQPATSIFNAPLTAAIPPILWPKSGAATAPAAIKMPSAADSAASKLVKQLQAQIQPLKQRTLLEGLISHFTIPDAEYLEDDIKCHVCLEPFLTGDSPELPIKLPCKHVVGSVCILRWLGPQKAQLREKNCPICRKAIYGVACASEWNALTSLEISMLGMTGKLQTIATASGSSSN